MKDYEQSLCFESSGTNRRDSRLPWKKRLGDVFPVVLGLPNSSVYDIKGSSQNSPRHHVSALKMSTHGREGACFVCFGRRSLTGVVRESASYPTILCCLHQFGGRGLAAGEMEVPFQQV